MTSTSPSRPGPAPFNEQDMEVFVAWRALALARMPYMRRVLFAMRLVRSTEVETFAVDASWRCYVNFDSIAAMGWSQDACAQVLLHECVHLWADHAGQSDLFEVTDHERKISNAAADISINDDLAEAGCEHIAQTGLMPDHLGEPAHQTFEHYLQVLRALAPPPQPGGSGGQGQQGSGASDPGGGSDPADDGDGDGQEQGQGRDGSGQSGDGSGDLFAGCGAGSGGEANPDQIDDRLAPADLTGASETEQERLRRNVALDVIEHSSRVRGSVPGGLVEQANAYLKPSATPWQSLLGSALRRAVQQVSGSRRPDHMRRDRRRNNVFLASGRKVVFPGTSKPSLTIAFVRDTSGSMSSRDLAIVSAEVEGIARRLGIRGRHLVVLDVDATVHTSTRYTGRRSIVAATGRGGTDMRVGIAQALGDPAFDAVVVATDGFTPWPEEAVGRPVVACLVGSDAEHAPQPPSWIRTVRVTGHGQ